MTLSFDYSDDNIMSYISKLLPDVELSTCAILELLDLALEQKSEWKMEGRRCLGSWPAWPHS